MRGAKAGVLSGAFGGGDGIVAGGAAVAGTIIPEVDGVEVLKDDGAVGGFVFGGGVWI